MSTDLSQLTSAPLPDITRNKHRGNTESELANIRVHSRKEIDRERILSLARNRGEYGVTLHEVNGALGMPIQTASARLSELKADQELAPNGEKRNHAAVLIIPKKGQLSLLEAV